MSQGDIVLSKKWGVNPTIPICWYCNKQKNQVAMLGQQGEKLARLLGHEDGHMPMATQLPLDYVPCDECRAKGIGIVEVSEEEPHPPTGNIWLVMKDAAKATLPETMWPRIEKEGYALVSEEVAKRLGLYQCLTTEKEDKDAQTTAP